MKKTIPVFITTVMALLMILDFFITSKPINNAAVLFRSWGIVIAAFAMGLGAINLFRRHFRVITHKENGSFFSFLLLASMIFTVVVGIATGTSSPVYNFIFSNILSAASSTMYAIIAFYIVTAAYRAFAARNLDGWILLITAVIVMLGKAPIGSMISSFFPRASDWIQNIPNTAGMRAIMMGAALGVISTAVKIFIGLDKTYLGQGE